MIIVRYFIGAATAKNTTSHAFQNFALFLCRPNDLRSSRAALQTPLLPTRGCPNSHLLYSRLLDRMVCICAEAVAALALLPKLFLMGGVDEF